jgi:hypothetical protein
VSANTELETVVCNPKAKKSMKNSNNQSNDMRRNNPSRVATTIPVVYTIDPESVLEYSLPNVLLLSGALDPRS